jgi:hypothetical protein
MTLTDVIILATTIMFVGAILFRMFKRKDESSCDRCSYAKKIK